MCSSTNNSSMAGCAGVLAGMSMSVTPRHFLRREYPAWRQFAHATLVVIGFKDEHIDPLATDHRDRDVKVGTVLRSRPDRPALIIPAGTNTARLIFGAG
jgi:hypothetical protein